MEIDHDLLTGSLVRLAAVEVPTMAENMAKWGRDSEYWRLLASDPARLYSARATREWIGKELDKQPSTSFMFSICTIGDNRLVGEIGLDGIDWPNGESFMGISLGLRQDWGQGYGTDAMRVLLRYAFNELNLRRISLNVFEYNPRAIRSYEKAGFKVEGRARHYLNRDGKRWDLIFMGVLREEWLNQSGI